RLSCVRHKRGPPKQGRRSRGPPKGAGEAEPAERDGQRHRRAAVGGRYLPKGGPRPLTTRSAIQYRLYSAAITIVTCTRNASATAVITTEATNLRKVSANAAGIATAEHAPVSRSTQTTSSPIQDI